MTAKIRLLWSSLLASLLLAGCAHHPPSRGASSADQLEGTQAQISGYGNSGLEPYQQSLSDPGPF
jgi:outer membrane biogenesis lipoprotein LolB